MIIPDVNLLIYAHDDQSRFHDRAATWLNQVFAGSEPVGVPWSVIQGFLRIVTNPRAMRVPLDVEDAALRVDDWLAHQGVAILLPGDDHWRVLRHLMVKCRCAGPLLSDAHLAALALENGALLCSSDHDFSRFPGLRWSNPL